MEYREIEEYIYQILEFDSLEDLTDLIDIKKCGIVKREDYIIYIDYERKCLYWVKNGY